jgi:hypothetical protein
MEIYFHTNSFWSSSPNQAKLQAMKLIVPASLLTAQFEGHRARVVETRSLQNVHGLGDMSSIAYYFSKLEL